MTKIHSVLVIVCFLGNPLIGMENPLIDRRNRSFATGAFDRSDRVYAQSQQLNRLYAEQEELLSNDTSVVEYVKESKLESSHYPAVLGITDTGDYVARFWTGDIHIKRDNITVIFPNNPQKDPIKTTALCGDKLLLASDNKLDMVLLRKDGVFYNKCVNIDPKVSCIIPHDNGEHYTVMCNNDQSGSFSIFNVDNPSRLWVRRVRGVRFIGGAWNSRMNIFTSCAVSEEKTSYFDFDIRQKQSIWATAVSGFVRGHYPVAYSPDGYKKVYVTPSCIRIYDLRKLSSPYNKLGFRKYPAHGYDVIAPDDEGFVVNNRKKPGFTLTKYGYDNRDILASYKAHTPGDCFYDFTRKKLLRASLNDSSKVFLARTYALGSH